MGGMRTTAIRSPLIAPSIAPSASEIAIVSTTGASGCARDTSAVTMPTSAMFAAIDRSIPPVTRASIWTSAIMARMPPSVISVSRLPADRNTGVRTVMSATIAARMPASTASRRSLELRTRPPRGGHHAGRSIDELARVERAAVQDLDDAALAHHHHAVRDAHQLGEL